MRQSNQLTLLRISDGSVQAQIRLQVTGFLHAGAAVMCIMLVEDAYISGDLLSPCLYVI